jgi:hypothetical protein
MMMKPNSVGIKLQEFDQQYNQLKQDVLICQSGDTYEIRKKIIEHRDEVHKDHLLLHNWVENSRSPLLSQLSKAQLDALNAFEDTLEENDIDREEATAIHVEHAIDFVLQMMRKTQLTMLYAADHAITNEK